MSARAHARPALRRPVHVLAFGLGAGRVPVAPGTAGTAVGVLVYLALAALPAPAYLAATLALAVIGIPICAVTARDLGVHDHPGIVLDEIVGFLVAMIAAPEGWVWIAAGFVLFRLFDVAKPWPIRWLDRRVGGGLGIVIDDVVAGLYALALLQLAAAI